MGELLRNTVCRSKEFLLTLYTSHIRPIMVYCSPVWFAEFLGDEIRVCSEALDSGNFWYGFVELCFEAEGSSVVLCLWEVVAGGYNKNVESSLPRIY